MKYLAGTIIKYVLQESQRVTGTIRVVLPSYPSDLLLTIGEELNEETSRILNRKIRFRYGIAYRLGKEWQNQGTDTDKHNFSLIRGRGWYNEDDNLTSIRNEVKGPDEDCLVIVLAGYEHVDDRASLQDFFCLNQQAIWEICLNRSFNDWIYTCLKDVVVSPDDSKTEFQQIAALFKTLRDFGLADLLDISRYLETQDFTGVMSGIDAFRHILGNLSVFGLPRMTGLTERYGKKPFSKYVTYAQEFFNYSRFLDATNRAKAKEKINKFRSNIGDEQIDRNILGSFGTPFALLDALIDFIERRPEEVAKRLRTADFIFIYEKILNYKEKKESSSDPKPKKVHGLPPEVFLRALWLTLGEFKKNLRTRSVLVTGDLHKIILRSLSFKHDFDAGDGIDSVTADRELAKTYLRQILGGIDYFIEDQVRLGEKDNPIHLESRLCPGNDNEVLSYVKTKTAEPSLKFEVTITSKDGESLKREFFWILPKNHQCRLLVDLYDWALNRFKKSSDALPVFRLPYISELFMARDEEEINRLLGVALQSEDRAMDDLLTAQGIESTDGIKVLLLELSRTYQQYLREFNESGFFSALDNSYSLLAIAYRTAYETFLKNSDKSNLGPLLAKAFMITSIDSHVQPNWVWQEYLSAAVLTPLHPVLLEMIRYQHTYLCESFIFYANSALEEAGHGMLAEKYWDKVVDLARVQWPVSGTLKNVKQDFDTNVRSYGYIHLVGEPKEAPSWIASRLLLEYDVDEDEEISDTDLFRETRASQLIKRVLLDYRKLYFYADDGISIGAYCGGEIQPVIAGIDAYLSAALAKREGRPYALQLTIFSDSGDDSAVMRWVNAWKQRWQEAELSPSTQYYGNCRISIAYRVVSRANNASQFKGLLQSTDMDVMFFTDFIGSGASRFEFLDDDFSCPHDDYRKFPVLEKAYCREIGGGQDRVRKRVVSNLRFRLGTLLTEVMVHLKTGGYADPTKKHAVLSFSDFQPWVEIIDRAHEHSTWVVCIDPFIDEQLLKRAKEDGTNVREIIGFGTGVGPHGQNNFTISTEQFSLVDIKNRISSQVATRLGPWEDHVCQQISESLVREASHMSGLSLVKATGPSEYVRDLIAYATVRKLLPREHGAFCDELISLDAFAHWFEDAADGKRPDVLRLQAKIINGYFQIRAQIIECKLAQQSEGYLEKARQQIENGLKQLAVRFRPREFIPTGIDDRPDQRYWWMQLHRLIATRGATAKPRQKEVLLALERLSEGCFSIQWQAAAIAFWTDLDDTKFHCSPDWSFTLHGQEMLIAVATGGREFVRQVCLDNAKYDIFCSNTSLSYVFGKDETKPEPSNADDFTNTETEPYRGENLEEREPSETTDGQKDKGQDVVVKTPIPERVLLGSGVGGSKDVYWEFGHPDMPNRHILVFGASGTGKTYTIQALLCELGKRGQNSLIVDYTNGFTNKQLEPVTIEKLNPKQHVIRKEPLAINPFRRQSDFIDDTEFEEDPVNTAQRVSGVFSEVYQLGDQQKSALYSAIRDGIAQEGNNFNLVKLIDRLSVIRDTGGPTAASAASVISKIQPFVDMNPFGKEDINSWERFFADSSSKCHIIQLAGFMKDMARLITEFTLIDLYWYCRARGSKDDAKVVVLDEIQNLDHRLESPLGQFLTEGRKFGISLILATQTLSNLEKDERDRLFQASHKLFFRPADTEIKSFAHILADATGVGIENWVERLSLLKRGECYSLGNVLNEVTGRLEVSKSFKIKIKALEDRF